MRYRRIVQGIIKLFMIGMPLGAMLSAQCSEIFIYRHTGGFMHSEVPVILIQEGDILTTVKKGDRYKATVCTPGEYELVIKTDHESVFQNKETFTIEQGETYYLKVNVAAGVEAPKLTLRSKKDGENDLSKGGRFKGAMKTINVKSSSQALADKGASSTNYQQSTGSGGQGKFLRSQTSHGFQFDIVDLVKAGDVLSINYKITNHTNNDRYLSAHGLQTAFYDDLGNFYSATKVCLMSDCRNYQSIRSEDRNYSAGKMYTHQTAAIPHSIPINASITVKGIHNGATRFLRGGINFRSAAKTAAHQDYVDFKILYNDIVFPSDVDPKNPNNRIVGHIEMELAKATRSNEEAMVVLNLKNNSNEDIPFAINDAYAYDDQGNELRISGISFGTEPKSSQRYNQVHSFTRSSSSSINIFLNPLSRTAKRFVRVKLVFPEYELEWDNIRISGDDLAPTDSISEHANSSSTNTPGRYHEPTAYMEYNQFETNVRNRVDVTGKKVILEKINFNSGSDEITYESYPQLNQIAVLLMENSSLRVEISGHTDSVGGDLSNMLLSQKRADAIRYYLIGRTIDPLRVTSVGKGPNEPISDNASNTGRFENRRVEIKVLN